MTHSTKYENTVLLGDFNACVDDEALMTFCKSYSFNSLIKLPSCFINPKSPTYIDLMLTNKPHSFQTKCVIETGLSDFHRATISVIKMHFQKLSPKVINYRHFKKFDNERFISPYNIISMKNLLIIVKTPSNFFFEICHTVLNTHTPKKKKYKRGNNKPFMTKMFSKAIMQLTRFRNKFLINRTEQNKLI